MTIVNFTINQTLEEQIKTAVREKGFQSKAEFFRVAAISYLNNLKPEMSEKEEFAYLASRLEKVARKKLGGKNLPSLQEQLDKL